MRIILLLSVIVFLAPGCGYKPKVGPIWNDLLEGAPSGPPKFQLGWKDGCTTGISVSGNAMMKHFYHFTQDSSLAQDSEYYTGWKLGYNNCQRYVFQYLRREYL